MPYTTLLSNHPFSRAASTSPQEPWQTKRQLITQPPRAFSGPCSSSWGDQQCTADHAEGHMWTREILVRWRGNMVFMWGRDIIPMWRGHIIGRMTFPSGNREKGNFTVRGWVNIILDWLGIRDQIGDQRSGIRNRDQDTGIMDQGSGYRDQGAGSRKLLSVNCEMGTQNWELWNGNWELGTENWELLGVGGRGGGQ